MLVLPNLYTYLSQLPSPPAIHTALLLTPEGALVSYASRTSVATTLAHSSPINSIIVPRSGEAPSSPRSVQSSGSSSSTSTPQYSKPGSVASIEARARPAPQRTKDEIRMAAGLAAEVWAETREDGEGMAESELGRILVLAVEDGDVPGQGTEPLLLLAMNGTLEADWDVMRTKARKLATFLAPSVNRHRGLMGTTTASSQNGSKSRTRSTATSPGRGFSR